jgi:Zn-dependent peptidase ImmA (M78 family)/transcriptional regulator with XRE-family HTH domain
MTTAGQKFEPRRLKVARAFHGLTLEGLGERVAASKQYINQLELGTKTPTDDLLDALAAALYVQPAFFFRPPPADISLANSNFRRLRSTKIRDSEQVIAHGVVLDDLLSFVEQFLGLPKANFPSLPALHPLDVERGAERARIHWGLTADLPIDSTVRVAENAGAVVVKFPAIAREIDALSINRPRPLIIRTSEKEKPTRLRFDIAHEIAHLVMHHGPTPIQAGADARREAEADRFASAFLLPRKPFERGFPRCRRLDWQCIFALKRQWNVSAQAILRRAYDLALIDAAQYRTGCVYISKQGYRRSEPFEPDQIETPELLATVLRTLHQDCRMSPSDVATQLGVQTVILAKLLGLPIPDLRTADPATVLDINAKLGWPQADWMRDRVIDKEGLDADPEPPGLPGESAESLLA